ncbi:DoxX family protein [Mesorhizobium sp. DCY119]|uniref:DoxX family protein n=1 Tax=Mesorhizobium sp. DCY119 TaxID=2108445 RepID=UPI000E74383A|nr:DoxX family protein [Mesorhizobium sp. DCY119]RJG41529.1 DoxX family protein [Mesorhizobium sp. DCY119]
MLEQFAPYAQGVMRTVVGLLFLCHGTSKILNFPVREQRVQSFTTEWYSGIIELTCGLLLTLGLFIRPAAFIASGEMAFAYFLVHAPKSFFPPLNGGDAAILFCFTCLFLFLTGPDPLSLDALLLGW